MLKMEEKCSETDRLKKRQSDKWMARSKYKSRSSNSLNFLP